MSNFKSYKSPKIEIKNKSQINGKGLFAKKNIKKGELIYIKSGKIVPLKQAIEIEKQVGEFCLQITKNYLICPTTPREVKDIALHINHSCDANCGPEGQITFIALRNIKAGEEICQDYATTTNRPYKLKCTCGSSDCRQIITGNDWKLKNVQAKYGEHFCSFILKEIKDLKT